MNFVFESSLAPALSPTVTIQLNFVFHGIVVLKFWTIQLHGS